MMRLGKKMFSLEIKIVSNLQEVLPKVLSKISAFVFLDKKQLKKSVYLAEKTLQFVKIFALVQGLFLKLCLNSQLLFFFRQKTTIKALFTMRKKRYIWSKLSLCLWDFPEILSKISHLDIF